MLRGESSFTRPSTAETRLAEAEETLRAIRDGEIDALVVQTPHGNQVYTLHSAEEPYRTLVEQMQEGAAVLTRAGDIVYANASFAALVGGPSQSVSGHRLERFIHPSDRPDVDALLRRGSGRCNSRLLQSDSFSVAVSLSLATTASSAGDRLNLIVTDLSDLREANSNRDRAQRDSRTKDEFLATFAHEVRNPLGAIGAAAQMLEAARATGGAGSTRAYEVIVQQVDHISRLTNDLLDVERVVAGKLRLNRQPIDVAGAVRQVIATFSEVTAADRRIIVRSEPAWVEWDAVRLQQVLSNVISNAIKYTPAGGEIRVDVHAHGGDVVVVVEDSGFGISAAALPGIFDMYMQVDRTLDHARNGLGIGLALVRRLVELHGGTVVASSAGEGRGSTFTVRLIRVAAPSLASAASGHERRIRQRRVLLIEDSDVARERLRTTLELAGHLVYSAADVDRGLELLRTVSPDVGIIDTGSIVDRRLVARRFRDEPHGRTMLLVGVGRSVLQGADTPPEDGFDLHFAGPVDADQLAVVLGRMGAPA